MNADCVFRIGKTHPVCQDYAVAAAQEKSACVVLADGCSSSADTDIGARLLAKSAERLFPALALISESRDEWQAFPNAAARAAARCAKRLAVPVTCLDATLMTIKAEDSAFVVSCSGDGVVALGRHDGSIEVFVITYAANYPQYASYTLDASRRRQWAATPDNAKTIQHWTLAGANITESGYKAESRRPSKSSPARLPSTALRLILSDGVQSFARMEQTETSRTTFAVPVSEVLAGLLAFKSGQGQFVQRRMQAFEKECAKRSWQHADDLSMAAVWLSE